MSPECDPTCSWSPPNQKWTNNLSLTESEGLESRSIFVNLVETKSFVVQVISLWLIALILSLIALIALISQGNRAIPLLFFS